MIIQLEAATAGNVDTARRNLEALAHGWGQELTDAPAHTANTPTARDEDKVIDPVSITALIVSLPSAALAVADLVDRIRNRRRATELIDHAQHLETRQVTVSVVSDGRPVPLTTLDADQLLDLLADENPTS